MGERKPNIRREMTVKTACPSANLMQIDCDFAMAFLTLDLFNKTKRASNILHGIYAQSV